MGHPSRRWTVDWTIRFSYDLTISLESFYRWVDGPSIRTMLLFLVDLGFDFWPRLDSGGASRLLVHRHGLCAFPLKA
ncbi:hypothetical protein HAX54_037690 [Datura stramonium]|uniref:Uncharacterized protein n=1 Tax=Datura stramonium TaxID=4076 RepID=A0ABS8VKB1_DATST|nr:hypothetical protein [Datura stramonium]